MIQRFFPGHVHGTKETPTAGRSAPCGAQAPAGRQQPHLVPRRRGGGDAGVVEPVWDRLAGEDPLWRVDPADREGRPRQAPGGGHQRRRGRQGERNGGALLEAEEPPRRYLGNHRHRDQAGAAAAGRGAQGRRGVPHRHAGRPERPEPPARRAPRQRLLPRVLRAAGPRVAAVPAHGDPGGADGGPGVVRDAADGRGGFRHRLRPQPRQTLCPGRDGRHLRRRGGRGRSGRGTPRGRRFPQDAGEVPGPRRADPAGSAPGRSPGHRQDAAGQGGRRRGGCPLLQPLGVRFRRDVRGRGGGAGPRHVSAGPGQVAQHRLHRRAGRPGEDPRHQHRRRRPRARADAQRPAGRDGRLRFQQRRDRDGGHQPPRDARSGVAPPRALRPPRAGRSARTSAAAKTSSKCTAATCGWTRR